MSENVSKICSTQISTTKHQNAFDDILRQNGYPDNSIDQTKRPPRTIAETLNLPTQNGYTSSFRTANIFRKENIPVRNVRAHRSHTLRRALSHNSTERTCTRDKCPISNTKLCLRTNAVYQITCKNCKQQYIDSTTRFIHDRVREHLNNKNSSIKKRKCKNKDYKGIKIKTIVYENDPANLRLLEAFYI